MKAVVYDKSKSPDFLILREVEKPIPSDNEVLVKIFKVSVNAADYRSMKLGIIPKRKILGADISGQVEAVGKNISMFKIGDEVLGDTASCGFGGFAEYTVASEKILVQKPPAISFEIAAAIPMASVTALQALRDKGNLKQGEKVLIYGAGGGVGTFAVQLAKHFGAEVTALCGEKNIDIIKSLGADHIIDYSKEDFTRSGDTYDLVLAVNGNQSLFTYRKVLSPEGVCVLVGGALSQIIKTLLSRPFMSIGSKKLKILSAKQNTKDLEYILKLVEEGKVKPVIDRHYPIDKTAEAVRYLSEGHSHGKVIIDVVNLKK